MRLKCTGNWVQNYRCRPMSSAFDPFVLFVSFVVKQFCTSARDTSFFSRPLATLTQALPAVPAQAGAKIAKEYWSSLFASPCPRVSPPPLPVRTRWQTGLCGSARDSSLESFSGLPCLNREEPEQVHLSTDVRSGTIKSISGRGAVWQRACMGRKRSPVQIRASRPVFFLIRPASPTGRCG